MKKSVLVIDDDDIICRLLERFLGESGFEVCTVGTLADARSQFAAKAFDALIIDQALPDGKGIDLIGELRSMKSDAAIVVITGAADIPLAVEAMQRGADNFLTKPVKLSELLVFLQKSLDVSSLRRIARSRDILDRKVRINFGTSRAMARVMEVARLAAESDYPVLISGETGVGKGVLARWVHENSRRRSGAFVEVGCPSFRGELLRSELYGHAKGSFTTAVQDQPGLLDAAGGGTLFLDEIGEMALDIQAQFLKVVEERSYRRLGEVRVRKSDFRLLCAANKDLEAESAAGRFRKDLLYRLQVLPIHIPALRERPEDIHDLIRHFLAVCNYRYRDIAPDVLEYLRSYSWPGNVRELQYLIERAVLLARRNELNLDHFTGIGNSQPSHEARPPEEHDKNEAVAIRDALKQCGNDMTMAAKSLGMSRATLYRRIKKLNLPNGNGKIHSQIIQQEPDRNPSPH